MPTSSPSDHSASSLFAAKVRVPEWEFAPGIGAFERLDRSDFAAAARVRALMDTWFSALPDTAKDVVRARFTHPRPETHLGAFFELYLHAMAQALAGEEGTVDLDVGREDGEGDRPDLLLSCGGGECLLEGTVAKGDDVIDPRDRPRVPQLYAALERIPTRDFLLSVNLLRVGPQSPGKKLIDPVAGWLGGLDVDDEIARVDAGGDPPKWEIDGQGWFVKLRATGVRARVRDDPDRRIIGEKMEGFGGHRHVVRGERTVEFDGMRPLRDHEQLKSVVKKKTRHRYRVDDRPFVLGVLCAGDFVDDREVRRALVGIDGAWRAGSESVSRVSALITCYQLAPSGVAVVEPTIWLNPHAANPLPGGWFPWRRIEFTADGDTVETAASRRVADVLGVGQRFPAA